jgi:hypothetical protein
MWFTSFGTSSVEYLLLTSDSQLALLAGADRSGKVGFVLLYHNPSYFEVYFDSRYARK